MEVCLLYTSGNYNHLVLVCGHYEGVDQRFIDLCVDEEISIGDFVLSGGELPAMVMMDSISRFIPGVLGNDNSKEEESFELKDEFGVLLEYPQYTRPRVFKKINAPEILFSGNHQKIKEFRSKEARKKTNRIRPDLS